VGMTTHRSPNVLIIIMDDLAYGDLACHGNPHTQTPHLDRLYGESTRLTRYCSGPLCTPARAALMTGRHPYRTGAIDTYIGRSMLHHDEITLAALLRDVGYATCMSGKWHLGDCYPMRPMDMGFDEMLMHHGGGLAQPGSPGHWDDPPLDRYFDPILSHNGQIVRPAGYCTDIFGDHADQFIRKHRDERWFCYLGTNAPHAPFEVDPGHAQKFLDMGLPDKTAKLYAMVENIDTNVGKLLDTLDELELAEDTIVVYTSDHGPCPSTLVDGQVRFNAGLRGIKGTMYEGGIRTPCFWRWPGKIVADQDVDAPVNPIDFLPTLAAACGFAQPTDRKIDGTNLLPLLAEEAAASAPRTICMQWHRGDAPVRYRNAVAITQQYKWYRPHEDEPDELYDIIHDFSETTNIAGQHPDVVEKLIGDYERWFDDVCSERPNNFDAPLIILGNDAEPTTRLTRQDWRVIHPDGGWQDQHRGQWFVKFDRPGKYRFSLEMPHDGPANLRIGDETVTLDGDLVTERDMDAGETTIEGWQTNDEGEFGSRYVVVERL
jgi:arylsulfatase A-like enzyme